MAGMGTPVSRDPRNGSPGSPSKPTKTNKQKNQWVFSIFRKRKKHRQSTFPLSQWYFMVFWVFGFQRKSVYHSSDYQLLMPRFPRLLGHNFDASNRCTVLLEHRMIYIINVCYVLFTDCMSIIYNRYYIQPKMGMSQNQSTLQITPKSVIIQFFAGHYPEF